MAEKEVVLVTGASGFIGSALLDALADKYTLVGLDRAGSHAPPSPANAIDLDLGGECPVFELRTLGAESKRGRMNDKTPMSMIEGPRGA
jgi:nucleoside-diphosphate-sugar epimerase